MFDEKKFTKRLMEGIGTDLEDIMWGKTPQKGKSDRLGRITYVPKDKESLRKYIVEFCKQNGWNSNLNHIDTSEITDMAGLFENTPFCGDISEWNVRKVTDMSFMFYNAKDFNGKIGEWQTYSLIDASHMFDSAVSFNQDLSKWLLPSVKDMTYMFRNATAFNSPLGKGWPMKYVKCRGMFYGAKSFNQDLKSWDFDPMKVSEFAYGSGLQKINFPHPNIEDAVLENANPMLQDQHLTHVWARVGMALQLTDEEIDKIARGEKLIFSDIMNEGRLRVDGNSYIPGTTLNVNDEDDRNLMTRCGIQEYELNYDYDIEFSFRHED